MRRDAFRAPTQQPPLEQKEHIVTEENDSIGRVGATTSSDLSGAQVDVTLAPRPPLPRRPARRAAVSASPEAVDQARAAQPLPSESLDQSLERINARLAATNRVMQLRVDPETGITVAEIRNSLTGQVLQQIPSTDVVHLAAMLSDWAHGKNILLDLIA